MGACSAFLKELPRTRDPTGDDGINKYSARVAAFPVDEEIKGMREIPRANGGLRLRERDGCVGRVTR